MTTRAPGGAAGYDEAPDRTPEAARSRRRVPALAEYQRGPTSIPPIVGGRRAASQQAASPPRVSIITAVLNEAGGLEETIRSVHGQRGVAVEHFVIDGGSTDGTLEVIRRHERDLAGYVSEPDQGIYDAINKGIALARGEYVGVLNAADTYCDDQVLAAVVAVADQCHPDVVFGDYVRLERAWGVRLELESTLELQRDMSLCHEAMFVSRAAYERWGVYRRDLRLAADHDLAVRLLHAGATFEHLARPLVVYGSGGASEQQLLRAHAESAAMLWQECGPFAAARYAAVQCRRILSRGVLAGVQRLLGVEAGRRAVAAYFQIKQHLVAGVRVLPAPPRR